jgi:hypothetical protein
MSGTRGEEEETKGKKRMSEEIVCVREEFYIHAEAAIRMDDRRWTTSVYKKRQTNREVINQNSIIFSICIEGITAKFLVWAAVWLWCRGLTLPIINRVRADLRPVLTSNYCPRERYSALDSLYRRWLTAIY